jgi:SAM-dependent methyltransferase
VAQAARSINALPISLTNTIAPSKGKKMKHGKKSETSSSSFLSYVNDHLLSKKKRDKTSEPPSSEFLAYVNDHLRNIESLESLTSKSDYINKLRDLGLGDFGSVLWSMPHPHYPRLSSALPPMTPSDITITWTGAAGTVLLDQGLSFVRACADKFAELTGQSLHGKKILDFGCGYGRFLRLFSYYTDEVYGVDAWETSLEHSRNSGFEHKVKKIDEVATSIPFSFQFDFIFAFSIFTHLSKVSSIAALRTLRQVAKTGTVLVITIRPVEFWQICVQGATHLPLTASEASQLIEDHNKLGFSYKPNNSNLPASEVHYGDTSLTLEWLQRNATGWKLGGIDRSINDPFQIYVALEAA